MFPLSLLLPAHTSDEVTLADICWQADVDADCHEEEEELKVVTVSGWMDCTKHFVETQHF